MKYLLLGGYGNLGMALYNYLCDKREVRLYPRDKRIDSTLFQSDQYSQYSGLGWIWINCVGMTSPSTERHPLKAYSSNVLAAGLIAHASVVQRVRLVHISTDSVFGGEHGLYTESDTPVPLPKFVYGSTKYRGEKEVRKINRSALILRAPFRYDYSQWPFPSAFTDVYRSSRWMREVVPDIIIAAEMTDVTGILHIGGPRRSVYDMAREVSPDVKPGLLEDFTDFTIPRDVSLDSSRWEELKRSHGIR